mmetsp:Transcript_21955/g.34115  ORF Transcript_21955/g.34115 Transcript_21955/m.34115 type:complete len:85 (+) Transcript_21955:1413-1667(+)
MDVADEAYDHQAELITLSRENPLIDTKITKATWRQWMSVFEQGKKVSEQNLVINQDDQDSAAQAKQLDSMSMLLSGSTSAHVQP